jgi:hypothetical protein
VHDRAPDAPTARPRSLEGTSAAQSTTSRASIIEIAERSGRTDLATRIKSSGEKLRRTGVELWVVGEHKKGKSSLVNALVNADVCPADPVWSTVVPIRICGGDELTTVATDLDGTNTECELDELLTTATELGNAGNTRRLRHVTVEIPRRLLGSGITLVDAPGVGGLESAVGSMTLAALGAADGALYVTDCSQELTSTELSYLRAIHERCGRALCVMSKSDLYVDVDDTVARNRAHLDAQDLDDVPLVTVSSALHLLALAEQDPALEAESGFDILFDVLHEHLWRPVRREQVAESGRELGDVATHLALPIAAELSASRPGVDRADQARRLEELQGRLRTMQADTAGWQQRLNDGYQDLQGDAEHALRERLRTLARMAEARIDASGENDDLAFEAWLRKAVIDSIAEHYAMITDRASMLTEEVGGRLRSFDREDGFRPVAAAPDQHLSELHVHRSRSMTKDGFLRRIVTTGQGYTSGMVLTSSVLGAGALIGGGLVSAVFPFLALPVAGLMAKKTFGDDRDRRDLGHRTELKRLANKYLDEVGFIVQKDSRDTVRQLHRETRTHFLQRTEQLQATIAQTIAAAQRAGTDAHGDTTTTTEHAEALHDRRDAISGLQATASRLVLAGETRGAA